MVMTAIGKCVHPLVFSGWTGHRRPRGTAPRLSPGPGFAQPSSLMPLRRAPWPPMTSLSPVKVHSNVTSACERMALCAAKSRRRRHQPPGDIRGAERRALISPRRCRHKMHPHPRPRIPDQSACLRKKAGISKSSMPPDANASTFAAAWVRLVRHTLGTDMWP